MESVPQRTRHLLPRPNHYHLEMTGATHLHKRSDTPTAGRGSGVPRSPLDQTESRRHGAWKANATVRATGQGRRTAPSQDRPPTSRHDWQVGLVPGRGGPTAGEFVARRRHRASKRLQWHRERISEHWDHSAPVRMGRDRRCSRQPGCHGTPRGMVDRSSFRDLCNRRLGH